MFVLLVFGQIVSPLVKVICSVIVARHLPLKCVRTKQYLWLPYFVRCLICRCTLNCSFCVKMHSVLFPHRSVSMKKTQIAYPTVNCQALIIGPGMLTMLLVRGCSAHIDDGIIEGEEALL